MKTFLIYALKEPDTGEIRYFGKTCQRIKSRFKGHLHNKVKSHTTNWIKGLKFQGQRPGYEILMTGLNNEEASEEEINLILWGRKTGLRLTNQALGGDGNPGLKHSEETRKKISLRNSGLKRTEVFKQNLRTQRIGSGNPMFGKSGDLSPRGGKGISGFFGVTTTRGLKWRASLHFQGKNIHIGCFKTAEEAARAYDTAALKYFGEFARINFPVTR